MFRKANSQVLQSSSAVADHEGRVSINLFNNPIAGPPTTLSVRAAGRMDDINPKSYQI